MDRDDVEGGEVGAGGIVGGGGIGAGFEDFEFLGVLAAGVDVLGD